MRAPRSGHAPRYVRVMMFVVAVSVAAASVGVEAAAQGSDPEALIREGIALRRSGDDLAAPKKFEQAHEIRRSPRGQLDIVGTPAGAEVRVDGELAGRLPPAHRITATVGGVAMEVRA